MAKVILKKKLYVWAESCCKSPRNGGQLGGHWQFQVRSPVK